MLSMKMNLKLLILLSCYIVYVAGSPRPPVQHVKPLGSKECTYGPTYWCKNITTAAGCRAVRHCIQTVWEHQTLPPDHTSVCETCLEMVKEARDQLQSNETQEEIKQVFEGSCNLIPVKVVAEACIKVADEFIVELVDALASQMNPQIVCSIAGLCNNERVHQLLAEMGSSVPGVVLKKKPDTCKGCRTVIDLIEKKFHQTPRESVLENLLLVCGRVGSLSDACSNIVIKYFNEIYSHLQENLNADEVCLMSGECSAKFHTHIADIEVRPLSNVGVVQVGAHSDDLPCDLCKQLVEHLRDILVANTTEIEFKKVLLGICKQTGTFKDECINLVNDYYSLIYNFLVNDLNGTVICSMVGICERPGVSLSDESAPLIPLLRIGIAQSPILNKAPAGRIGSVQILDEPKITLLPIERILPQTLTLIGNTELCTFCEYFLHFVQQAMTDPKTEDSIKQLVDHACEILPGSVNETCRQFVDTYGPAFIAILAQEIDPSVVCPKLSLCPSLQVQNVEIFMHRIKGDKPNCPMCLLALESLYQTLKNKKTEESLKQALSNLCSHLHGTVEKECKDFVETYTDQIIEASLAHLTPSEICEYLHLCKDKTPPSTPPPPKIDYGGNIDTNEISDGTANGKPVPTTAEHSPLCVMCEFVLTEIDKQLSDNATEEEIKHAVYGICNYLPKSVFKQCTHFVDEYADVVIQLLLQELDPSSVCTSIKLCTEAKIETVIQPLKDIGSIECEFCKKIMHEIEHMIVGKPTEEKVVHALEHVCKAVPKGLSKKCKKFVEKHGKDIVKLLLSNVVPKEVCKMIQLCDIKPITLPSDTINSAECELCKKVLEEIEHLIVGKSTEEKIINAVHHVCKAIPKLLRKECDKFINKHGAEIIKLLEANVVPKEVCKMLQLCRDEGTTVEVPVSITCPSCKLLLEKVDLNNVTEKILYQACINLHFESKACTHFALSYGEEIVYLVRQRFVDRNRICDMLPVCSRMEIVKLDVRVCAVCNAVVHYMKNIQGSNISQRNIFEKACRSLPNEHHELCNHILSAYKDKLLEQSSTTTDPKLVCLNAGLCPKRELVGENKCTWGPSYWCMNTSTANKCGMLSHCQENYWTRDNK